MVAWCLHFNWHKSVAEKITLAETFDAHELPAVTRSQQRDGIGRSFDELRQFRVDAADLVADFVEVLLHDSFPWTSTGLTGGFKLASNSKLPLVIPAGQLQPLHRGINVVWLISFLLTFQAGQTLFALNVSNILLRAVEAESVQRQPLFAALAALALLVGHGIALTLRIAVEGESSVWRARPASDLWTTDCCTVLLLARCQQTSGNH